MTMRENEAMAKNISDGANTCAARQSAASVLLERADRLRRQAGELHQEADRFEQLGRWAQNLQGHAEDALWRLAINAISASAPRLF
jgi:hypothetical protein